MRKHLKDETCLVVLGRSVWTFSNVRKYLTCSIVKCLFNAYKTVFMNKDMALSLL